MQEIVGSTVLAALLAALGFLGKQVFDSWLSWRRQRRERLARLGVLRSLLLASREVFDAQVQLRRSLCRTYCEKQPNLEGLAYDEVLASGYANASNDEKTLHGLVRQYTVSAIKPLNAEMREWLRADDYFKVAGHSRALRGLSPALQKLEAHLVLWSAKYDFWIPNNPERALVYLADEHGHGVGFPTGIEDLVSAVVDRNGPFDARDRVEERPATAE